MDNNYADQDGLFDQPELVIDVINPGEKNSPLLPERYPQGDLFVCELVDVVLKSDMASMEYPLYSLAKKPDRTPRRYENGDRWIEFRPSTKGLPTIYDKDLLIYVISHIMREKKRSGVAPRRVRVNPYHFLIFTNRSTGGRDYEALAAAVERLDGTRYRTNVKIGGKQIDEWFGLIERVRLESSPDGKRLHSLDIELSSWAMEAVNANEVLTLNKDYWRLRRPIERRVYEIIRKHCGRQLSWSISVDKLHKKSGSMAARREFRRKLTEIVEDNHLPDYHVALDEDTLFVMPRDEFLSGCQRPSDQIGFLLLAAGAHERCREAAPEWCPRYLETVWRGWTARKIDAGDQAPRDATAAYIGFARRWYERKGAPS